jgi:hypothetical protein
MNDTIDALIRECVLHIAENRLDRLNYLPGYSTQSGLARVLAEIGSPVIPMPDGAIARLDVHKPSDDEDRWLVEFQLSTRDEQPSGWWLSLIVLKKDGRLVAYIDDLVY